MKEPKYIVSRKLINGGRRKGKLWVYTCDNGTDYESAELAKLKDLTIDCLASRIFQSIKKHGAKGLSSPDIFRPVKGQFSRRAKGQCVSDTEAKGLLNIFLRKNKIQSSCMPPVIHLDGFEPVLTESCSQYSGV